MLKKISDYVVYGYPTTSTITTLLTKRGYINSGDDKKLALTNNADIEDRLGEMDILCVEDIVEEITTIGAHFNEVNKLLWAFQLAPPSSKTPNKRVMPHQDKIETGNVEERINSFVKELI